LNLWAQWHERLTGAGVGERTRDFWRGMRWTMPAAVAGRLVMGVASVLVARFLGPEEFGAANLALAATLWVQVPLFLGIPTALLHYAPAAGHEKREPWLATGFLLLCLTALTTLAVGFLGRYFWAGLQGLTAPVFVWALVWSAGFFVFTTAVTLLAARENFKVRAAMELAFALILPAVLFLLWRTGRLNAAAYVLSMAGVYALVGAVGFLRGRPARWTATDFGAKSRRLLGYGVIASGGGVAVALLQSVGKLTANRFLPLADVGVLSAYMAASVQMALYFLTPVTQVFFPIASRAPDKRALFDKLRRLLPVVIPIGFLLFGTVAVAYFLMLGKRFPFRLAEWAVFSLAAALALAQGMVAWLLAAGGRKGIAAAVVVGLLCGAVNAAANHALIPRWGILGAGAALVLAYAAGVAAAWTPWARRSAA